MGVPTQLTAARALPRGPRRGIALVSALFGIVAVMVLALGVVGLSDARLRAAKDREASVRAVLLAEEGMAHAMSILKDSLRGQSMTRLLRGSDNLVNSAPTHANNTDNGRLAGYTLSSAINIPAAGRTTARGTYQVRIIDDPTDPAPGDTIDGNLRIIIRCTATTTDGGSATVHALIAGRPSYGVVVDGPMTFQGANAQVRGSCGSVHANGNVTGSGGSGPQLAGLTSSGTVTGSYRDTTGTSFTPATAQPSIPVAPVDLTDLCSRAQYTLRSDGYLQDNATGSAYLVNSTTFRNGWRRTTTTVPHMWVADNPTLNPLQGPLVTGTYCVQGNVQLGGAQGTSANPARVSIISTHSIQVGGTPFYAPSSTDSVLFAAAGDVEVAGNSSTAGATNYEGLIYANAQCNLTGNVTLRASIVCRNQVQPTGSSALITTTTIAGSARIIHTCNGWLNGTPFIKAWWQPTS